MKEKAGSSAPLARAALAAPEDEDDEDEAGDRAIRIPSPPLTAFVLTASRGLGSPHTVHTLTLISFNSVQDAHVQQGPRGAAAAARAARRNEDSRLSPEAGACARCCDSVCES